MAWQKMKALKLLTANMFYVRVNSMRILLVISLFFIPLFYSQASDLANSEARAYRERGYRLQSVGDFSGALMNYEKAVQIDPNYAEVHNDLGVIHESMGDEKKALMMYKKALDIDPDHLGTYTNLAFLYEKLGDIENATLYWKKRYLAGQQGEYWWEVARQHLLKLGTYPEVRKAVLEQEAARLSRDLIYKHEQEKLKLIEEARLHFDLGSNAFRAKDYDTAVKEFRTVLSLNAPDDKINNDSHKFMTQAQRLLLREQAYTNTKNALEYIEKDDYLSAGDKLKSALTAVFRVTQTE
jgi:Flp pilus assembly protein TadD